jgi:hypothetical protein
MDTAAAGESPNGLNNQLTASAVYAIFCSLGQPVHVRTIVICGSSMVLQPAISDHNCYHYYLLLLTLPLQMLVFKTCCNC